MLFMVVERFAPGRAAELYRRLGFRRRESHVYRYAGPTEGG